MARPSSPSVRLTALLAPDHDEDRHRHEEPAEVDQQVLHEGNRQTRRAGIAGERHDDQRRHRADADLPGQLALAGQALGVALGQLEEVVAEADHAEADGDEHHDPDIDVGEVRPQQGADDDRDQDHQAAHGGRALLLLMGFRPVAADRLAIALLGLQPADQRREEHEADDRRGQNRSAGPKRNVSEQIEDDKIICQREQQVIEHLIVASTLLDGASRLAVSVVFIRNGGRIGGTAER